MGVVFKKEFIVKVLVIIFLFVLSLGCWSEQAMAAPTDPQSKHCTIYLAAALFALREKSFNVDLASRLEHRYGYKVVMIQRDGFQFRHLDDSLKQNFPGNDVLKAEQVLIYYLDMGYFIPRSDVIVAILDEEMDPGVLIEMTYANLLEKHIIGIRTDARSPYGAEPATGLHFFALFQLDRYGFFGDKANTTAETSAGIDAIAKFIHDQIAVWDQQGQCGLKIGSAMLQSPTMKKLLDGADILYSGIPIKEINSPQQLQTIIKRYSDHQKELSDIYPEIQIK